MNFTSEQFDELASLYGEIADGKQKKREHVLAKRMEEAESLTPVIQAAQDRIHALLPDDLSEADRTRLSQDFTLYHKHPATLSRNSIDKILPGFAAYAESRLSDGLTVDLTKSGEAGAPAPAEQPAAPQMTLAQFDELGVLFTEWNRLMALEPTAEEEKASRKASLGALRDKILEILPKNLSDSEHGGLLHSFWVCYDPKEDASYREKRILEIEGLLPGFAAYAETHLPKLAPPAPKTAAPAVVLPSEEDIRDFGQEEAEFIAASIQKNYLNGDRLIQNYRQALRGGGAVRGVNYTRDDVNILRQSPENITLFEQRISGAQQSVIDDYIKLTLLAVSQHRERNKVGDPYLFAGIYGNIKAQLREPLEKYEEACKRVFDAIRHGKVSSSPFLFFSSPEPEDIQELKEAVALRSKMSNPYKNHLPLIPADQSNDIYGPYDYRQFNNEEDQLAFLLLLGDIKPGEKGGLFRKGTPAEFLGVDPAKLQAYKDILAAALPRMIQKAVNLEYEKIFIERKLAPDYLLFRNLYGGEVGAGGFCRHCHQVGAERVVPELLYKYGASSAPEIETAYGKELEKNSTHHRALLAAEDEIHKRDIEWNNHVRNTLRDKNVMVAEPLKKKYIRSESYYAEGKKEEAEQLVQSRGIYPSSLFPPTP